MTHLKRQSVPKRWPVARKGTPFVVKPNFNQERGIPLLIALRDMLKLCQNRKEAKRAIYGKKIFVNSKEAKDEKNTLTLFDTIGILSAKKYYKVILTKKGKYSLEEITEKESAFKISRIIKKKTLNGKKIYICGEARLINLAAAEGHPSEVMDTSFCGQALACEYAAKNKGKMPIEVINLPDEIDNHISKLKLEAYGVEIDELDEEQIKYLNSWQEGT